MSPPDNQGPAGLQPLQMLPDDVDSPQFAEGLRLLKDGYADRTSFNHFVCDELARRGIPPNSRNVLKYGRWGQSVAVAADVRSWFVLVSRRLSTRHANIPDVCQQQFNALGEQFWALALQQVGAPLREEIARLQDAAAQEAAALQARLDAAETARNRSEQRLETRIHELTEHAQTMERSLQQSKETVDQAQTQLRLTLERAVGAERALEQARKDFEARIAAIQATSLADKNAREQSHKEAIEALGAANARLETQLDAVRRDAAAQIDKARQDSRVAEDRARQEQVRADSARTETEGVREQLMNLSVAHARVVRDLEVLQAKLEQVKADSTGLAQREAGQAALLAREDALLELAQSAAGAGIELRVSKRAKRPDWIGERTWKSFVALANAAQGEPPPKGPAQ